MHWDAQLVIWFHFNHSKLEHSAKNCNYYDQKSDVVFDVHMQNL